MLDGVFNPPAKRTNDDLDSEDEEEGTEANHSEKNTDPEIADTVSEANTEATETSKTSVEPQAVINDSATNSTQDESNNSTLVPSQTTVDSPSDTNNITVIPTSNQTTSVSPSAASMPTTFGSENVTSLRFLRKSLNLSRNNSIDSNGTPSNDNATRPNKIRIEARIDSDKKSRNPPKSPLPAYSRSKRNLRYNKRNNNLTAEIDVPELAPATETAKSKPREPEIIEKILSSPEKSPPRSRLELQLTSLSRTPRSGRLIEKAQTPQRPVEKEGVANAENSRPRRSTRTSKEVTIDIPQTLTSSEEVNNTNVRHLKTYENFLIFSSYSWIHQKLYRLRLQQHRHVWWHRVKQHV